MKGNFGSIPANPIQVDTMQQNKLDQMFLAAFVGRLGKPFKRLKSASHPNGRFHPHQGAQECERRRTPGTAAYGGGCGLGQMMK